MKRYLVGFAAIFMSGVVAAGEWENDPYSAAGHKGMA